MAAAPLPPLSVPLPCPTPAHREESLPASPPREVPPIGGAPVSPGGHDSDDDDEPPVLHPPAPEPRPTHHQPHHHIALASCGLHPAHDTSIHAGRDLTPSMYVPPRGAPMGAPRQPHRVAQSMLPAPPPPPLHCPTPRPLEPPGAPLITPRPPCLPGAGPLTPQPLPTLLPARHSRLFSPQGKGYGYSPPAAVFDDLHWVPQGGGTASLSPQPAPLPQHPRCQVFGYSPSRVTADDDDATPTPSLSHPPPTPALTKPPPVTTTTTTTSDVTPHPTPPQTTGKVTGKACEVSQNELVKLSGLFKYHWNCSSEEEEEEVRECAKTLYSGAKEWREMRRNLKENRSRMTSDSRSP
ncbi:uncharacterized protein LOC135098468 isoform X2 [Scylla paramamosain]|uniref:uncharacterized protein LOC135098468 isoform X2 n=1 Tax=Scylla paramamosain TaxID=85552 RepID=UPI0030839718